MFIHKILAKMTITFCSLEGLTTLVSKQREGLQQLYSVHARMFNSARPSSDEYADAVNMRAVVVSDDRL